MEIRLSLALAMAISLGGCEPSLCGNKVLHEVEAPGGTLSAILYQRDCGATTGFSSQVSVIGAGEQLKGSGNTFVADKAERTSAVEIRWLAPKHLLVIYDRSLRIFKREAKVRGVEVSYSSR